MMRWFCLTGWTSDVSTIPDVLLSIAAALRLTPDERQHLFLLADLKDRAETQGSDEQISPAIQRILDALNPIPAYIIGHRWNYLAWNTAAEQVLLLSKSSGLYENNAVWRIFTNPMSLQLYSPNWEQVAQKILAVFRADSAPFADEDWFKRLIADLSAISPEFRAWWPRHDVRGKRDALKTIEHPLAGRLMFEHTTLQVPVRPELKLMVYTPLPDTDTLEKLRQLMV